MALIVEDGTGLANSESYLSVADAATYHTNYGNAAWDSATTASKEAALRNATQYLDSTYLWKGTAKLTTQALLWPRDGVFNAQGASLDDIVPPQLEDATAELALQALSGDLLAVTTKSDHVTKEKVDVIEIEYSASAPSGNEYVLVSRILRGLYESSVGGSTVRLVRV